MRKACGFVACSERVDECENKINISRASFKTAFLASDSRFGRDYNAIPMCSADAGLLSVGDMGVTKMFHGKWQCFTMFDVKHCNASKTRQNHLFLPCALCFCVVFAYTMGTNIVSEIIKSTVRIA